MPKATVKDVRASLIRAGVLSPDKKVEVSPVIRGINKPTKPVSRLNAILQRRGMTSHA